MTTREEYEARAGVQDDWAPGWDAIDEAFENLYPGQNPKHLATAMPARAVLGGPEHIDGYSIFTSPKGHLHGVTYGMSSLYSSLDSFGGEFSGWGYEMTTKVRGSELDDIGWALNTLGNLARYTYSSKRWFEPYQFVLGSEPLREGSDSSLTCYLIVPDTEIDGIDTLHGRVDFLQLVGITKAEGEWVAQDASRAHDLADRLRALDPVLSTDLGRASLI